MRDRESTFADPKVIKMLKTQFVPVAIDQAYQRRQKDTEGEFYRKIAGKSPRGDGSNGGTTQGLFIAAPDGTYLGYSNHRSPERIQRLMNESLRRYSPEKTLAIERRKTDPRFNPKPPKGGLIVRVQGKVLGGYEPSNELKQQIYEAAISRDNLWISQAEHEQIAKGTIPKEAQLRLARYHLWMPPEANLPCGEVTKLRN